VRNAIFVIFILILGLGGVAAYNSYYIVLELGKPKEVRTEPGLYWKIPLIQSVVYFDKRILDMEISSKEVTASDQKRLVVDAFARYKIVNPLLFFQSVTNEAGARARLDGVMDSAMRGVLGGAPFIDVVRNKREELMRQIAGRVNGEAKDFGIEVVDVRIKHADLPPENSAAIYSRMQTERKREATELRARGGEQAQRIRANADRQATVIKAEATRDAERLRGEGDAERNRIYAAAFSKDQDFFAFYRSMQAYEEGLKKGDTRLIISPNSEFFRYFKSSGGEAAPK
jgi:membrane protease subunit HflC